MLSIVGQGPGSIHLVVLLTIFLLETSQVILIEALTNRSVLSLLSNCSCIKYVGRSLYSSKANLYGVLLFVFYICSSQIRTIWVKNGDALMFNRSWCQQLISMSTSLELTTIPGITSAISAFSINNINLNCKLNNNILLTCGINSIKDNLNRYASVIYMSKLKFYHLSDNLICLSMLSNSNIIVNSSIGLLSQSLLKINLRDIPFFFSNWIFNLPTLVVIGDAVNKHYWINWLRFNVKEQHWRTDLKVLL
ncbi:putative uroporphyrin-III c-methyltransferase [Candidatus Hodgkinia cicadicola]|uniref:Uroporphyrin-III c-methyltransferase n=1 Tax=Candidatus Hodgkinia cicadicola TaxID=573658 RepID=A0ABX4MGI9_9HYPH|nr:putative uroporphyrin-III c-methyltransferase [Candidatus Hodgkinia cicadicola]